MVSITVRALILAFAFGVCIAGDFKMHDSKCKVDNAETIMKEGRENFTTCVEKEIPGADPKTAHKELSKDELKPVYVCMSKLSGVISEDGVFDMDVVVDNINTHMTETEQTVLTSLITGVEGCATGKDPKADSEEIMECVHDTIKEVCEYHKKSNE